MRSAKRETRNAKRFVIDLSRLPSHGRDLALYKVCAIDATWSGLKFAKRKP